MSRRGENIYKRKDGRWEGRYIKNRIGNKAQYGYIYAHSYHEVKEKILSLKNVSNQDTTPENKILFSELCKRWITNQIINSKPSTVQRYSTMLKKQILPFFDSIHTSDISTILLTEFIDYLFEECHLSEKTASNVLGTVKSILCYGEKINVEHSCILSALSIKVRPKEMRVLTCDEYKKLTTYCIHEMNTYTIGLLIALMTGVRIGELCALKYSDINIESRYISINKTMQRLKKDDGDGTYVNIDMPKSNSSVRMIPVPDLLCDIILHQEYENDDYILTHSSKFIEPRTVQYKYTRIMKDLGIEGTTFHTLRHSFATRCVEVGFDIKSLSEILGHSNVNITLNRYVHSSFEFKVENMKKLNAFIEHSPSELSSIQK